MTRHLRILGETNSSASVSPDSAVVDSDFVVILAALICALICVLGLVAVARCACLRRLRLSSSSDAQPPPPLPAAANKGVKKKVLRSLPKLTATVESAGKFSDCAICLTEFAAGDEIRVLPQCGHGFHVSCIDAWLRSHSSCPSCRQILMVSRCDKCGGIPATAAATATATASSSSTAPQPPASEARFKATLTWESTRRGLPLNSRTDAACNVLIVEDLSRKLMATNLTCRRVEAKSNSNNIS